MLHTSNNTQIDKQISACPECDLLTRIIPPKPGDEARCSGCGYLLSASKKNSVRNGLAVCLSGLILWFPAVFLPTTTLKVLGQSSTESVYGAVLALIRTSQIPLAIIVFLVSIAFPLVKFILLFYALIKCTQKKRSYSGLLAFRWYHSLKIWGMLEVYILGVLTAIVKLAAYGEIEPGMGMVCFTLLMLCAVTADSFINDHNIWNRLDQDDT